MRILLVFPGALFSTLDVANGYMRAFKRMEGVKLFTFQFHNYLVYHEAAQKFIQGLKFNQDEVIAAASEHLLIRILQCRPDVVIFISGLAFPTYTWVCVKQLQKDLKHTFRTAVVLTESPYIELWEREILKHVDLGFVTDYGILPELKEVNQNLFYLKHAYDPEVHFWDNRTKTKNVFMVGTGFPERQRLLEQIDWGDNLELYGNWMYMGESPLRKYLVGGNLDNTKVAEYYRDAKISLNIFRTVQWPDADPKFIEPNQAKSLSPRVYETLACGSLLLTDWREELETLPKDSYVLWGDAADLEEKVKWYLAHDEERERISKVGLDAIQGETFDKRANEIVTRMGEITWQ